MTTGRINQVHASPPGCNTLTTLTCRKVYDNLVALHQKLDSHFRGATLCAALLAIKTYTLTPKLRTPRRSKHVKRSPSRLGYCMLFMLSFTIHTLNISPRLVNKPVHL